MTPILLSFDFDGTTYEDRGETCVDPAFHRELEAWRSRGALWVVNTGRSLPHTMEGLVRGGFTRPPAYLITRERDIHERNQVGRWVPVGDWNARAEQAHARLFRSARSFFREVRRYLKKETAASFFSVPEEPAGIIASYEEEMVGICRFVDARMSEVADLRYERNGIYLRFSHAGFNKGTALAQLAAHLGVPKENILAAGDNYNDMSMLDSGVAGHLACPGNSVPEVCERVKGAGGYLAQERASTGMASALRWLQGELE